MKISSVSEDLEKEYPHLLLVNTEINKKNSEDPSSSY